MKLLVRWRVLLGRRGTTGAILLLAGLLGMAAVPLLDGSQAHYVHIRWRQGTTAEQQERLEWRHGLRRRAGEGRSFGYDIVNESSWNVRALLDNPFVEDSQDLDHDRAAVAAAAPRGEARNGWAWRWGLEDYVPSVAAWANGALLLGLLLLLGSRPVTPVYGRALHFLPNIGQRHVRRSVGILMVLTAGLLLGVAEPVLRGVPAPTVAVWWQEGFSPDERQAREVRYGFREQFNQGRTFFSYDLVDDSGDNVRAIAADRSIVSLEGIDRVTGQLERTAPAGRSRTGLAWRWGIEAHLSFLRLVAVLLLVTGVGLTTGWQRTSRAGTGLARALGISPGAPGAWRWTLQYAEQFARVRVGLAVGGVFLFAFLLRLGVLDSRLGGDDHWSLWTAATFLNGDRPFHEVVDPGDPLYWGISALAQWAVGYRAIGEVGVGLLLVTVGVTASFWLSWRASGSLLIALGLVVVTALLVAPAEVYSYPKIFLYPFGLWLSWRYVDRPGLTRGCLLALGVSIAFGYRHDHGAYLAIGAVAAVLAAHWKHGYRDAALSLFRVGLMTILILSPYFFFIQFNEGLISYFAERAKFAAHLDSAGRQAVPFVTDASAPSLLAVMPQQPVDMGVEWIPGLAATERAGLEKRFSLTPPPAPRAGGLHSYLITDYSEANLTALLADRHLKRIVGISGSFRQAFALDDAGQRDGHHVTVVWRASATGRDVADAERRFRLTRRLPGAPQAPSGPVEYDAGDPSVPNVTALRQDPRVEDVRGVHLVRVPVAISLSRHASVGPPVSVQWTDIASNERGRLEQQFQLLHGRRDTDTQGPASWTYDLGDRSDANVSSLATHPQVVAVRHLRRGEAAGTFRAEPWTPPRGVEISIVWGGELADDERRALEQRYHLAPDFRLPDAATPYRLMDASPAVVRALGADPNVVALAVVDGKSGSVPSDTWFTAMGRRFPAMRLLPLPRLFHQANAGVWLYYVAYTLPLVVLALLLKDWWRGRAAFVMAHESQKLLVVAVLMVVANLALLRKLGYFIDHFDVTAIMAAWLLGRVRRTDWRRPVGAAVWAIALVVVAVSSVAAATYVDLSAFASRHHLASTPLQLVSDSSDKLRAYATSPPIDHYASPDADGDRALVRYLYECTNADDRIFVTSDLYTVPYYTQRRVVGHVFWANGFMANRAFERRMIGLLERDPVPFVFGAGGQGGLDNLRNYPHVQQYVANRYTQHHAVLQENLAGGVYWLLVDGRRTPTGTYAKLGLPCFADR